MSSPPRITHLHRSVFTSTGAIFGALATIQVGLTWLYDTRIAPLDTIRSRAASAGLPPEVVAVLARPHITLIHCAMTVALLAIGVLFLACCLQGVFLGLGKEIPMRNAFRAVLIASAASTAASAMRAAEMLITGSVANNIPAVYATASLASALFPPSTQSSDLYVLFSAVTIFEVIWCALLAVQLVKIVERKKAFVAVGILWFSLTIGKWALITYIPRLLI